MSMNKGKAKAKPARKVGKSKGKTTAATAKSGPKPAVMNRRKYNKAISGDTTGNYAMYKAGGTTKVKKFAALAPPYDKATVADRIAGAKKNSKKK